jgi:PBSX family phage terminase large subunit
MSIQVEIDKQVYLSCFHHLLDDVEDIDIELIWGGRDSGKSIFLSQFMLEQCMSRDYFRCILVKETHESIKDAQWQSLKDIAEDWQVDQLFKFGVAPMSISCVNKNTFLTRGLNDPGRIRSIANPSGAWVEEANQISEDGFITLITSLRSDDQKKIKLWMTFNPESTEANYEDFWMYKMFFKNHYPRNMNFIDEISMKTPAGKEIKLRYRSTHVTYQDNPFVTDQRVAIHESLQYTNYYWYQVFTLGLWGNKENDSPYAYAFDRKKHVTDGVIKPHPVLERRLPLILSWDFNRNPMTCTVAQHDEERQKMKIHEVIRIPKSGVDGMCEYILVHYPGFLYIVTGDYNGDNESSLFEEQITHYKLIQSLLNLSDAQIRIRPNPKQQKNSTHINTVLSYYDVEINGDKAKALVFDCQNVKRRADGTILKSDRDKPEQQADALDCMRYLFNEFLDGWQPTIQMILTKTNQAKKQLKQALDDNIKVKEKTHIPNAGNVIDHAIDNLNNGDSVVCSRFEYYHGGVREALQEFAKKSIRAKNTALAELTLAEIKRLDKWL